MAAGRCNKQETKSVPAKLPWQLSARASARLSWRVSFGLSYCDSRLGKVIGGSVSFHRRVEGSRRQLQELTTIELVFVAFDKESTAIQKMIANFAFDPPSMCLHCKIHLICSPTMCLKSLSTNSSDACPLPLLPFFRKHALEHIIVEISPL